MLISAKPDIKFKIIYEMLSRDNNLLNITWLCEIAGVSRTGYYYWLKNANKREVREAADKADFKLILWAYGFRGYAKGVLGIRMRLFRHDPPVVMNAKRIRRLMHKFGLVCPIRKANPYRRAAATVKLTNTADNLLNRQFKELGARNVLLTDVTYLKRKSNGKWTYMSTIMDAYTTELLGVTLSESLEEDFVLDCVKLVMAHYGSEISKSALLHSDQGSLYKSNEFIKLLTDVELRRSMSRKANCWDNAPQESLFGHMKDELHLCDTDTHEDIVVKIMDWWDYYNTDRPQDGLLSLTPNEYYEYCKSGVYPLPIPVPTPHKYKKIPDRETYSRGSAPEPPRFNALGFQEDGKKDDN